MEKISEYDFSIDDVLKGKEQTKAIVRFRHKDGASGTVEVDMVKEGTEWKIDSLNTPKYD